MTERRAFPKLQVNNVEVLSAMHNLPVLPVSVLPIAASLSFTRPRGTDKFGTIPTTTTISGSSGAGGASASGSGESDSSTNRINSFDESDLDEQSGDSMSGVRLTKGELAPKRVLPQGVPSHLLMVSLLEHLCALYVEDPIKSDQLFKVLCHHLSEMKVMSPLSHMDELSSIRTQYRVAFSRLILSALAVVEQKPSLSDSLVPVQTQQAALIQLARSKCSADGLRGYTGLPAPVSRYKEEFIEIGRLGTGGFGTVYKVKHKLDGREYAVKKILFKTAKPELWMKIIREVKVLAALDHPNVVGYNAAWMEHWIRPVSSVKVTDLDDSDSSDGSSIGTSEGSSLQEEADCNSIVFEDYDKAHQQEYGVKTIYMEEKQYSSHYTFEEKSTDNISQNHVHIEHHVNSNYSYTKQRECAVEALDIPEYCVPKRSSSHDGRCCESCETQNKLSSEQCPPEGSSENKMALVRVRPARREWRRSISLDPGADSRQLHSSQDGESPIEENILPRGYQVALYIQMQLCTWTLADWLRERNAGSAEDPLSLVDERANQRILKQVLKGVEYIHSKAIMHRDLTPKNIFLQGLGSELNVRLGDFGLARDEFTSEFAPPSPFSFKKAAGSGLVEDNHTSGIGTVIYAAPEQLKNGCYYNSKCDMYSLGIVLFEMFHPFHTGMERVKCLDLLRKGDIPECIRQRWPIASECILDLTQEDPLQRPSANQLLQGHLFVSKDERIQELEARVTSQQLEIEALRRELCEKDRALKRLGHFFVIDNSADQ